MARVGIVIVTYNSADEIGGCLHALTALPDVDVWVVDNASTDGTRGEVARHNVHLIANAGNAGFARAVNQGVRSTSAPFVLLLNPDAHLVGGKAALDALMEPFANSSTGAAGGRLLGADGRPQTGFMARNLPTPSALILEVLGINRLWPRNPVNWHYRCLGLDVSNTAQVEQPAGAFLMFSRAAFEKVGGFDERFSPIWFEDVDFCAGLKREGYRAYYVPQAVANHTGGHSIVTLPVEIRERYWYGSLLEYAAKYYRPVTFRLVCFAVVLGAVFRACRGCAAGGGWKVIKVYEAIVLLAFGRMFRSGRVAAGRVV